MLRGQYEQRLHSSIGEYTGCHVTKSSIACLTKAIEHSRRHLLVLDSTRVHFHYSCAVHKWSKINRSRLLFSRYASECTV